MPSRLPAGALAVALAGALLVAPGDAGAQRTDSTRVGAKQPGPRRRAPGAAVPDSLLRPPLSPRSAFLYSLVVPGLGQAKLDRPNAGALFVAVEILGVAMARKSASDLVYARRAARDTIIESYDYNDLDEGGRPKPDTARNRYQGDRVKARRTHYEDWLSVLVFNHLLSGLDAFVAAQLWDLPGQVSLRAMPRGAALGASLPW